MRVGVIKVSPKVAPKNLISELVETARDKKRVVGKEFFSMEGGSHIDIDGSLYGDDPDIELSGVYDSDMDGRILKTSA